MGDSVDIDNKHGPKSGELLCPHRKGHGSPTVWPMSIVVKRSPISATAELLLAHKIGPNPRESEKVKPNQTHG